MDLALALSSNSRDPDYVPRLVEAFIRGGVEARASDVHCVPTPTGLRVSYRIDGVLQHQAEIDRALAPNVVARLKVLANLLTYRTDVPQEGRLRLDLDNAELRLSTFPTIHGEKAVVRLFVGTGAYRDLDRLALPPDVSAAYESMLRQTSGVIILCGPAGSGKTTTAYAGLRWIHEHAEVPKSLVSLEDPVEAVLPEVSQTQVSSDAELNYATGLRSLMRQDPDVVLVGEIRDRETAVTAFQAALTGHLVLTTFHAGSAATALSRLRDMGIEPFLLRSAVLGIICQRLFRAFPAGEAAEAPSGGRFALAEWLHVDRHRVAAGILEQLDANALEDLARRHGMVTVRERAAAAVEAGRTTRAEVYRVLGDQFEELAEVSPP